MIIKLIYKISNPIKIFILLITNFIFSIFGKNKYWSSPQGRLYLNDNDPTSTRIILGTFEKKEKEALLFFAGKDDSFVDVGCNIGFYSFLLSSKVSRVFSIDPYPENLKKLSKTLSFNKIKNLNIIEAAASSSNSVINFHVDKYSGLSHIQPKDPYKNQISSKKETIKIRTFQIDDLDLDENTLIKIDVEGHEMEVLKGMKRTLELQKIRLIMIELYDDYLKRYNSSFAEVDFYLNKYGYYRLKEQVINKKLVSFPIHNNYFYSYKKLRV